MAIAVRLQVHEKGIRALPLFICLKLTMETPE